MRYWVWLARLAYLSGDWDLIIFFVVTGADESTPKFFEKK